jgi:hypothetical protein
VRHENEDKGLKGQDMKTMRGGAILLCGLALAGQVWGQNGQVTFRGTVGVAEAHDVVPVCYGDYHITVDITGILADPNMALKSVDSVQVCYATAMNLAVGEKAEVNGYYWGGICPKQYCKRVQITTASDYITRVVEYGDDDWMVSGNLMYSIPSGNVGIGTSHPWEKLHVVGNLLVQGASPVWLKLMGVLGDDAGISLTTTGAGVNTWEILREGASSDLVVRESFPYPPFGGNRLVVEARTGNVGIATDAPDAKLHVLGDVRVEVPASATTSTADAMKPALRVSKEGAGRQLAAYFVNPRDGDAEVDVQLGGGKLLPWGWSLKGANGLFTISNVAVLPPAVSVTSTGYVGIADTTPEYRLELPNTANAGGQGRANAWKTYSSQRWKTNVRTIDHAMDKVRDLRGVSFDWKGQGKHDIGMIAEEVGRVVPEIVDYETNGTDASSLAYDRLVAVLVEAVKEQDARIAELEQAVARSKRLEQRLDTLERLMQQRQVASTDEPVRP